MKICSRVAKTCFGDTDLIQIKVWVDQMEKQNGEKIAFPCHESYTKFAVNDDTLTAIWAQFVEEFGQKFGQLANFYKNQINETEKLKTEMFAANKENAFNFFMTAMYSIGRIYNRLSRTSTRCYRAMTAVGRTLDSFTEESSPKA